MGVGVVATSAAVPLLAVLAAMLGLRWSAARAGALGLGLTLPVAWFVFGFGTHTFAEIGVLGATGGALLEAAFIAGTILWIVFPALCIHELQLRTGAIEVLRGAMARLAGDPRILALLVAWFFVLFVEGAAGFGTSVALAAPLLVAAGFGRVEAVAVSLTGHAAGVSFGAVGTPVLAPVAVTPFGGLELAAATAVYHALATFVGPELPTLGGSLLGVLAFVAALRLARGRSDRTADRGGPTRGQLTGSAAPYLPLVAAVLATRLLAPLRDALAGTALAWRFDAFEGSFAPLYHPGSMLLFGFVAGAAWQRPAAPGRCSPPSWACSGPS